MTIRSGQSKKLTSGAPALLSHRFGFSDAQFPATSQVRRVPTYDFPKVNLFTCSGVHATI